MEKPITPITKTCSVCGQQKPLAAFLQLGGGQQGDMYGNICSSCRKTALEEAKRPKEAEEGTRSTTGLTIDSKTKVKIETDKKQLRKETEELHEEERDEKVEKEVQLTDKKEKIAKGEKNHRESYIERRSFLDSTDKARRASSHPVFGGEEQKAKEGAIRLDAPVLDTQIAGKIKYQGSVFNQFKAWLGASAPIVRATQLTAQKTAESLNKKGSEKEAMIEKIEKNWGPKKSR